MKYGPYKMVPMVTEPGVDRSLEEWDTGQTNFGYIVDARFPEIILHSDKVTMAREEALAHWRHLCASNPGVPGADRPEGFMLIGPYDAVLNHYIDDGETTGVWAFGDNKDKAVLVEIERDDFQITHSKSYGTGRSLVLWPPEGIRHPQLNLPEHERFSGWYCMTVSAQSKFVLRDNVRISWCSLPGTERILLGDELLLGFDSLDEKPVLDALLEVIGKRVKLKFESLETQVSRQLGMQWAFRAKEPLEAWDDNLSPAIPKGSGGVNRS